MVEDVTATMSIPSDLQPEAQVMAGAGEDAIRYETKWENLFFLTSAKRLHHIER